MLQLLSFSNQEFEIVQIYRNSLIDDHINNYDREPNHHFGKYKKSRNYSVVATSQIIKN